MNPERPSFSLRTATWTGENRDHRDVGRPNMASLGQSNSTGSALEISGWQQTALQRMQERATQLVQERKALRDAQTVVEELEAELQQAQEENELVLAAFAKEQVQRYSLLQENQKTKAAAEKEELRIGTLQDSIARLEEEIKQEEEYQESFLTTNDGDRERDGEDSKETDMSPKKVSGISFLEHVGQRRVFQQALESRVKAKTLSREKREEALRTLESSISHMNTVEIPSVKAELNSLVNKAKSNQQEVNHIVQYEVPSLSTRIRDALNQRADLRKTLQEAQAEHDQAREIMEEAERQCLDRSGEV